MKKSTLQFVCIIILCSLNSYGHGFGNIVIKQSSGNTSGVNFLNSFTPFFSEDFSGGLPAGWKSTDSSGHGVKWHYTTTGTYNTNYDSLSVSGTSAGNGYMIFDSDSAGQSVGGENADLVSPAINCVAHASVHLIFNEYLLYYNDTATVWVSNDDTTWTLVHNSSAGLSQYQSTPNPNSVDIDISSIAAHQSAVYIRFNYRADYSFFWMIDDVQLYESPSIEATVAGIIAPVTGCNQLTSTEPVVVAVYNSGGDSITGGFDISYKVDSGNPVTEHVTDTIAPGDTLHYTFQSTADFSVAGYHIINSSLSLNGDTIPSNDSLTRTVHIGPFPVNATNVYAIGFELSDDLSGYVAEDANGDSVTWHASTLFPYAGNYCAQLSSVTADDWYFTTCIDLDSSIVYRIKYFYRSTSTATTARFNVVLATGQSSGSAIQEIVPSSLLSNTFYQPASYQFTVLFSGTYYVGLHVQSQPGDSLVGLLIDNLFIGPDAGVGIDDMNLSEGFLMYPNPASEKINLKLNDGYTKNFRVEVLDVTGKLLLTEKIFGSNNSEIDVRNLQDGTYFIRMISDNNVTTHKIGIVH